MTRSVGISRSVSNPALTLALCLAAALAGPASAQDEVREQSSRDWDAAGISGVQVANPRGLVSIHPGPPGRVRLVALKVVRHGTRDESETLARATRVETGRSADRLWVRVGYPQRRQIRIGLMDLMRGVEIAQVEVQLALEVPPGFSAELHSSSGDLESDGLGGSQRLQSASGDITVGSARGPLWVETTSGDARLDEVATAVVTTTSGDIVAGVSRGALTLSSGSGDVRVASAGGSVEVSSTSGEVRIGVARAGLSASTGSGDVVARAAGRVRIETSSGDARVTLLAPLVAADVRSAAGDVVVKIPAPADCALDAESGSGSLDVRLPISLQHTGDRHVKGTLGRGTVPVLVRTRSGSATVES